MNEEILDGMGIIWDIIKFVLCCIFLLYYYVDQWETAAY
jgi:hypothetical protein